MEIRIAEHKRIYGKNQEEHNAVATLMECSIRETLTDTPLTSVNVYNMLHDRHNHTAGGEKNLIIFVNATSKNSGDEHADTLFDEDVILLPARYSPVDMQITNGNDLTIAEFNKERNQLNILYDMFGNVDRLREKIDMFRRILSEVNTYFANKENEFSWKRTADKAALIAGINETVKEARFSIINENKRRLSDAEQECRVYREKLKLNMDKIENYKKIILSFDADVNKYLDGLIRDMDLISNFEKVKDVQYKDNLFHIYTHPLICTDTEGRRFKVGSFRIEINLDNTKIRFYGDTPRKSFWSEKDYHPHIKYDGNACLGNIDTTVAEFCSTLQLYPLCMLLIDYLETANLEDTAGRHVTNWERVS